MNHYSYLSRSCIDFDYSFIENYGTHVVVGLSMGGQDVVYVKQDKSSQLPLGEIKHNLDKLGDQLFTGICTLPLQQGKSKENKSKVDTDIILLLFLLDMELGLI
jgi:MAC/Perforin domain